MDKSALDKGGPAKDHGYCNQPRVYPCHGPEPYAATVVEPRYGDKR